MQKILVLFLVLVITASFFTGCRKKTPEEKKADYSGIELTYYKVFDDSDVIEPYIQAYIADHPGLKINYKKFSDFEEYQKVILNEMAEGEGPDIFAMPNTWFMSNYKKLAPLPSSLGTPEAFAATFVETAYKDLVRPDKEGVQQIYALPMTVDNLALYYNKEHFEDNIPTQGKPSSTWEGIKEDVLQLTKQDSGFDRFDVSGIALGRADNISRAVDILYLLFLQYGVEFYDDQITEAIFAGKFGNTLSYPGMKALEFYASFADETQKNYTWNEFTAEDDLADQEIQAFAEGKVSMIVGYAYTYDLIVNYLGVLDSKGIETIDKSAIRIAPIPQLYDPKVSKEKRVTYASYFAETVSRNSEHAELAWDFLLFLTDKENLAQYFEDTHNPTSRRDLIEEQKKDPIYGVFATQVGFSESFPVLDYYLYKDIFSEVINRANIDGVNKSDLVYAQDLINEMIPKEGLLPDIIKNPEEEKKEEKDESKN